MTSLTLAVIFFVGIHLIISGTRLRDRLVSRLGEATYMGLFSLCSFVGLSWMIWAYDQAPVVELWGQVYTMRWLSSVLILIAITFIVLGLFTPNPTSVGGERLLAQEHAATGIIRITRHPFLSGFAIWSATHLAYNGDLASLIFFGGFFILSITGPLAIDTKQRRSCGADWQHFADKTSIVPMLAIVQGRNQFRLQELGWWRLALALIIYILIFRFHALFFGVAPMLQT